MTQKAATADAIVDSAAPMTVRLSMYLVLGLIASFVGFQSWTANLAEVSRSTDAEIVSLAVNQRTHSQRIARLAFQSASDTAQMELEMVLLSLEAQAEELERLLAAQGVLASSTDAHDASPGFSGFRDVIHFWQASRAQFVARVNDFVAIRAAYDFGEIPRVTRELEKQADAYFYSSQLLAEQTQRFAENHGVVAKRSFAASTGLIIALLCLLALAVVEPTARFVRRQYGVLRAQGVEMRRLALVAANTSNWVVINDLDQKITWANQAFLSGVGLPIEQVIGQTTRGFLMPHGNDMEEINRAGLELMQGLGVRMNLLVRSGAGHGVWLDMDCQPLFDVNKKVTGYLAVGNDITAQVVEQRKLRALFDALPVGVVLYSKTGVAIDSNAAALKVSHLAFNELPNYETMVRPSPAAHPGVRAVRDDLSDYPMVDQPVARTLRTAQGVRKELVGYQNLDGTEFWVMTNTEPLLDAKGELAGVVECFMDVSRQKRLEQRLRDQARTDVLTQLPNRLVVTDQISQALLRRVVQPGYHFAVLFMDFDRFKQVNDTLGHLVGDELLRQIAQRLQSSLRPGDAFVRTSDFSQMAARIGGDEFVVLLDDIRGDLDAEVVAGRMLEVLATPYFIGEHTVHSSVSIGVVTATHATGGVEAVLRDADIAMYEAKRTGRGRYVMFEPSMHRRIRDDVTLENDLRQAFVKDELFMVYQPLVDLKTGTLSGMEALVRWKHPVRGMVSPVEFIPIAEASGLIVTLGAFVLQRACAEFVWLQEVSGADAPPSVSVNLSRAQLRESDLVSSIRDTLRANGMVPSQLQLEITESLAAQDQFIQTRLQEIKALGVTLALDDFGTGYSSLSCLAELPIDTVKVDRAFVSMAQVSDYHRVLIEATILMADTLGMTTVAEGIETQGQAEMMKELGCTKGQGYLYSKPLSRDALVNWIVASREVA